MKSNRTAGFPRALRPAAALVWGICVATLACTPTVGNDPTPDEMEFDTEAPVPRVPEPTGLILNPASRKLDFSLAGTPVPTDCADPQMLGAANMAQAQCEFLTYLQSLDGYPTATHARAPTTATALLPSTVTLDNIVVVDAMTGAAVTDVKVGFDPATRYVSVVPDDQRKSWTVGASYWLAVRGYANGLRADNGTAAGNLIVASPTQFLLKQETPLTCGAATAADLSPTCPAFALLGQGRTVDQAVTAVLQLEQIRKGYLALDAWGSIAGAGVPKAEVAVLWGFPVHSASVAELDPTVGLVPQIVAADEIHIGVQGTVDPATVIPFILASQSGSVVVMDLTALQLVPQTNDLRPAFPTVDARFAGGQIVIKAAAPFTANHQIGVFLKSSIHNVAGKPLVAAPVSKLLTLHGALVDASGHSTVSAVADSDAVMLEAGRQQFDVLLNDTTLRPVSTVLRDELVYCYGFPFEVP
jgi:hypothetical protein